MHSFSQFRTFKKCQRQWFYRFKVKCPNTKDPFRQQVIKLSYLDSIHAFRGNIVDYVIDKYIVKNNGRVTLSQTLQFSKDVFDSRRMFAESQEYLSPTVRKSHHPKDFAALREIELGTGLTELEWQKAWEDIEVSLTNLLENSEIMDLLQDRRNRLIAQRPLTFTYDEVKVRAVPDLLIFHRDKRPPTIIDWKVNYSGNRSYIDQLIFYAYAVKHCPPHVDFHQDYQQFEISNYTLLEYQLLKNEVRRYTMDDLLLQNFECNLSEQIYQMQCVGADLPYKKLLIENFDTAYNEAACQICPYQNICFHEN